MASWRPTGLNRSYTVNPDVFTASDNFVSRAGRIAHGLKWALSIILTNTGTAADITITIEELLANLRASVMLDRASIELGLEVPALVPAFYSVAFGQQKLDRYISEYTEDITLPKATINPGGPNTEFPQTIEFDLPWYFTDKLAEGVNEGAIQQDDLSVYELKTGAGGLLADMDADIACEGVDVTASVLEEPGFVVSMPRVFRRKIGQTDSEYQPRAPGRLHSVLVVGLEAGALNVFADHKLQVIKRGVTTTERSLAVEISDTEQSDHDDGYTLPEDAGCLFLHRAKPGYRWADLAPGGFTFTDLDGEWAADVAMWTCSVVPHDPEWLKQRLRLFVGAGLQPMIDGAGGPKSIASLLPELVPLATYRGFVGR